MILPGRQRGFSIVELMVAVTIAIVTGIVVLQVLSTYEARRRTITVGNDAEMSAAVGLYMIEREVRMAGAGFTTPTGLLCGNGINVEYDGTVISDGDPMPFARITDGGAGADRIDVMRSDSAFGVAPATVTRLMGSAADDVSVESTVGLRQGDLFLVASSDGVKRCTLMQVSAAPTKVGSSWTLVHGSGSSAYNPTDPAGTFTNAVAYDVGDVVFNLGTFGVQAFRVVCNDGAAPSTTNSCVLGSSDAVAGPDDPAIADLDVVASQVVDFQAQYGVAPAGSQDVNEWVDATGEWEDPDAAHQRRIKAIRMSVVTRGSLEREMVSPDTLVLWDPGGAGERTIALTDDQRYYRYKVLTVVVPIINMIWAGV
ncbi:MAG: PilW family protein [Steroidobacteraceae bacterium]